MRIRTRAIVAGAVAALMLMSTAACSSGGDNTNETGKSGGTISVRGCTPQNALIGANTGEVCGGHVLDAISSQLVYYNTKTTEPEMDIAESIETDDSTLFTVKLKKNYLFSDGTEVKAHNFVDAWNWASYAPNAQQQATFFQPILGWDDLQCETDGCTPAKDKMDGLKVIDDYTFTIETSTPTSNLVMRLGYKTFQPLPDVFLNNPTDDSFGKMPVGAGPFKVTENSATQIVMEKRSDYSGKYVPSIDKVIYRIYNDNSAAWADVVANNLDFDDVVPSDQMIDDAWITTLGADRTAAAPSGTIEVLTFSPTDDQLKGNVLLRQAIGEAIDRDTITKVIFAGSRSPLTSWVAPVVDGYKDGQCGKACVYDPAQAKKDYDAAGGYNGTFMLSVNGDGGHKPWADAVCNNLLNNLGMDCQVNLTPDFRTLLNQAEAGELTGMFRSGWAMDYPSIENFLTPIYAKGAGSNYSRYDNPDFEAKLRDAAAASSLDEGNELYQEAERMLAETYPTIPAWSRVTPAAWSNKVDNVIVTAFGYLDYSSVTVK